MTPATSFRGKRVALFGLGGSGLATVRSLVAGGAEVVAFDDAAASVEKALGEGLPVGDLREVDFSGLDSLVLAPGVPLTHPKPHWTVEKAKAAGVEIIGDIEIFCRERRAVAPGAPFVAITGTNGKSTTTALVAHLFREAGRDVQMGGNIGVAILDLEPPSASRVHVVECSSYQIDLAPTLDPTVGVLLNVSEDHLDRHGTMENYVAIKARILEGAENGVLVVDDEYTRIIAQSDLGFSMICVGMEAFPSPLYHKTVEAVAYARDLMDNLRIELVGIGTKVYLWDWEFEFDCVTNEDELAAAREELFDLKAVRSLRGRHNVLNAMAAWSVTQSGGAHHIHEADVARAIASFPGLAHRMEELPTSGRVVFINDSKATNVDSAEKALASFEKVFWILGGKPKTGGIEALAPFFGRVEKAYLIGEAADAFAKTFSARGVDHAILGTVERAVEAAAKDAQASGQDEPVVLFSPACASFDQYRNFEERGEAFRRAVLALRPS